MYFTLLDLSGKGYNFIAPCDSTHLGGNTGGFQGGHRVNIIKLQVMFGWSLEWDCKGQISLPHWDGWEIEPPPRAVLYIICPDMSVQKFKLTKVIYFVDLSSQADMTVLVQSVVPSKPVTMTVTSDPVAMVMT